MASGFRSESSHRPPCVFVAVPSRTADIHNKQAMPISSALVVDAGGALEFPGLALFAGAAIAMALAGRGQSAA